ncbi:phage tail tube protein [Sphingobium sp. DC-2]|uniref:phage tail tube protein n=1 Tax=Sphingobium sp. DC-2 TaxID=1303256 RepID=UPI0004C3163D|nr:phage tail tube protein [Sphingobium sp. DC-2]
MNEYGKDWRVCIGDGEDPEVFTALGGETGFSFRRASAEIDLSDKSSGSYGSTGYGQQKLTISVSGNLKLPDAAFSALFAASKASPPEINVQIKKGSVVKFHGLVGVGNFSSEHPQTGAVTFSCDMANIGAPIVDDLTATV